MRVSETARGTYTLLVAVARDVQATVGALGKVTFEAGWYAYTGSAQGPGGLARVRRHREVAAGDRDTRHWHVDYLLGLDAATVDGVVTSPGLDGECEIASRVAGDPLADFGASDCDCASHLSYSPRRDRLLASVDAAHDAAAALPEADADPGEDAAF
jgi:endonuclease-3